MRTAADPDATLLDFLQCTNEAAAVTSHWDRAALERASHGKPHTRTATTMSDIRMTTDEATRRHEPPSNR